MENPTSFTIDAVWAMPDKPPKAVQKIVRIYCTEKESGLEEIYRIPFVNSVVPIIRHRKIALFMGIQAVISAKMANNII